MDAPQDESSCFDWSLMASSITIHVPWAMRFTKQRKCIITHYNTSIVVSVVHADE
jgi:hypothetical protein